MVAGGRGGLGPRRAQRPASAALCSVQILSRKAQDCFYETLSPRIDLGRNRAIQVSIQLTD